MNTGGFMVLGNPRAGGSDARTMGTVLRHLAASAPVELIRPDGDDEIDGALRRLTGRIPVVVGGDGSIHRVVARIVALGMKDVPLGIVPAGTANDLAQHLELPEDPGEAAAAVIDGVPTLRPIIETGSGLRFVNNAHVGLGVRAARRASDLKRWLSRAYPAATAVEGARSRPLEVRVEVDGRPVVDGPAEAVLFLIGSSMGGGVRPLGKTDDDIIDVVVIHPDRLPGRLRLSVAGALGRMAAASSADRWRGQSVTLTRRDDGQIDADVDGELMTMPSPLEMTLRPDAWTVLMPGQAG